MTSWCGSRTIGHCSRRWSKYGYGSATSSLPRKKSMLSKSVMRSPSAASEPGGNVVLRAESSICARGWGVFDGAVHAGHVVGDEVGDEVKDESVPQKAGK